VGLAIGVTPLWGLHLPLVLFACVPLRLDARVAYLAANISLPFIAPLIATAEIELGALVRAGHAIPIDRAALHAHGLGAFAGDLAVGTLVLAPSVAAFGFALTLVTGAVWPERSALGRAIARAAARYPTRAARIHARAKLATDPVTRALAALGDLGDVVDVGGGAGHMASLLLETKQASRVRGVDIDPAKVALARAAGAELEAADARAWLIPECDTVLLLDVLHYVEPDAQDAIVARAAKAARRRVLVREIEPRAGLGGLASLFTRAAERLRARPNVRPPGAIAAALDAAGFAVTVERCDEGTPFANALVIADRRAVDG
jgi:SAM-dependent methyltransferase